MLGADQRIGEDADTVELSHGADAERLRGVGQQLTASAQSLDDAATTGRGMAQFLVEHWSGADLEHFVGQGWPAAEGVLHSAAELVRGMGEGAIRNADEQDSASQGSGGVGGSTGGGGSGGAAPLPTGTQGSPEYTGDYQLDYGSLNPDVYDAYMELGPEGQKAVLQEIVNQEAAEMGIDPPPQIIFDPKLIELGYAGTWNGANGELRINPATAALDPRGAMNAAVHEMRHAQQTAVVNEAVPNWLERLFGAETEAPEGFGDAQVDAWAENQGNYESPPSDEDAETMTQAEVDAQWEAYFDQPVEVDARRAGKTFIDDLTLEEFEDILEESRS